MKKLDRKTVKEFQTSYDDFKQAFIELYLAYKPDAQFNEDQLSFAPIGLNAPYASIEGIFKDFKAKVFDKEDGEDG